ncbi:hypothetical protein V2J09_012496 [Rumex salicifolius]
MNFPLLTLLAVPLFALLAVTGVDGRLQMLPRRGRQERAICSAEGRCLNQVVTCPADCPERKPQGNSQQHVCVVDCAAACAATCKTITQTSKPYQTWCNKTNNESLCASMVQSDPRDRLKTSPQGLVVILVSAAQAKANATRLFINESLKNQRMDPDSDSSNAVLNGCLLAYELDWVKGSLSVDVEQVSNQQSCSDLNDSLRTVVNEVTYDCEWDLPSPRSETLNRMYDNVESLASIVESARHILSLIGCGAI